MKKTLIIGTLIFVGLVFFFYSAAVRKRQVLDLYDTVEADFADKYPTYKFIDCVVGEGDLVVTYVHVRFSKTGDDKIREEVWQYWDTDSSWLHRDKYLKLTKVKND